MFDGFREILNIISAKIGFRISKYIITGCPIHIIKFFIRITHRNNVPYFGRKNGF